MSISAAAKFVGGASEIAYYYGFRPLSEVAPRVGLAKTRPMTPSDAAAACTAQYAHTNEPILIFYASSGKLSGAVPVQGIFSLQIASCSTSIGEVHILKTLEAIVRENGGSVVSVHINCLGDRDSRTRFARELGHFLRRHASEFEPCLDVAERTRIFENPLSAYRSTNPLLRELLCDGPRPVHFLSEKSRVHFRQVLDQLEHVHFPYEIDDSLIGDENEPRVVFNLHLSEGVGMITGSFGGRYDELTRTVNGRPALSMVHASISFRTKAPVVRLPRRALAIRPKIYLIQFGDSALLSGFSVRESLRRAHIPTFQQFDARHLAPQLHAARQIGVPYVLIMGQREALDHTVIIRTVATSAQTTVPIAELSKHLRTLKFA